MAGYNQKIVRTNSYVEIWEYEKPIFNKDKFIEVSDSIIKKENSKRKTFDELTTEEQNKRLERMSKTRLEAKWKLLRLVDCNFDDKTSFLTLTTKKNIEDRNEFTSLLKTFIKRFNYNIFNTKKSELKYLTVLERQKRNAWHAHILLFEVPYIPHEKLLSLWGHGAVRINKVDVDSKENRGRYVTKYFEKGIGQELLESFGKNAYLSSRNLLRPEETKVYLKDKLEFNESAILYETEYISKIYRDGLLIDNPVKYKKIRLIDENNSDN
ncbi:Rep protein [Brochothrix thermosphacta]|uniref:Rep protein n=1 Tax=Brochothrix thermosphacta TaxID=2756 RepID=A0A1D2LWP6_BROTH|nr:Rep protein [Brochothrix thermosphacta]ATF26256.1 Rep protein [Brochothrix thermosphacta]ATH85597.1 Rep protein [Brochothrix thermosphacta]MPQ28636.1 Rep protein [Brochothrix thermosphacta]ODJ68482.1 Rep protein [Brochothrix thermosphacta]ODJ71669.1 Rep protein [Brochothrix thermosphacta]